MKAIHEVPNVLDYLTYQGILPSQWGARRRQEPEVDLWLGVMEQACRDREFILLQPISERMRNRQERRRRELDEWIATTNGAGSFNFVCEALGIESDLMREKFATWTSRILPRKSPRGARSTPLPRLTERRKRA